MLVKDFVKQVLNGKEKQVNGCFIFYVHNQVFEQYWYENNKLLNKGNIVEINGRVQRRFDKYQIVVNSIKVLE